jgi:hypothetical protein
LQDRRAQADAEFQRYLQSLATDLQIARTDADYRNNILDEQRYEEVVSYAVQHGLPLPPPRAVPGADEVWRRSISQAVSAGDQYTVSDQFMNAPEGGLAWLATSGLLRVSAEVGNVTMVRVLLAAGANPLAIENDTTALHIAAQRGHVDAMKGLINEAVWPSAESRVDFLMRLFGTAHAASVPALLDAVGGLEATDSRRFRPLHHAAADGRTPFVLSLLLARRPVVDAQNMLGQTALHLACHASRRDSARLLWEAGANVRAVTLHGVTPLHEAAASGNIPLINELLAKGALPTDAAAGGYLPVHFAEAAGEAEAARVLAVPGL